VFEAQCLCGGIKLNIREEPLAQVYCHCSDCQVAQGAAYVLNAVYPAHAVEITSGVPLSITVKDTPRFRCPACATPLFTEVTSAGLRSLNAYLLPEGVFSPQMHLHCADAQLPVADSLPHYARLPASFGGSDERVIW
jgi:hypothetical protein